MTDCMVHEAIIAIIAKTTVHLLLPYGSLTNS